MQAPLLCHDRFGLSIWLCTQPSSISAVRARVGCRAWIGACALGIVTAGWGPCASGLKRAIAWGVAAVARNVRATVILKVAGVIVIVAPVTIEMARHVVIVACTGVMVAMAAVEVLSRCDGHDSEQNGR